MAISCLYENLKKIILSKLNKNEKGLSNQPLFFVETIKRF